MSGAARVWADVDRLDGLIAVGVGLVGYGVSQIYSSAHAAIVVGAALLVFTAFGLVFRISRMRPPIETNTR